MLPFFAGERSVGWNPRARAAVIGMSLETTALDILQAGMEAVAYRFAAVQRLLDAAAGPAGQTVATGGALFRSRAWTQIIADVLERPVTLSRVSEASSRGAALLALEALGRIPTVDAAVPLFGEVFQPREERRAAHRAAASRQESLYRLLAGDGEDAPGT
jgi:gluconokinase